MRKIWLTNHDNSDIFNFENFGNYTFMAPTSLGIYREKSFIQVNSQQVTTYDNPRFERINGTILIKGANKELETLYARLRDFISKYNAGGFRLYVQAENGLTARYINCEIESLDKTEKTSANTMSVPITLIPKSLWLGDVSGASVVQKEYSTGMFRFSQRANGTYSARFEARELTTEYGNKMYSVTFGMGEISQTKLFNSGEETSPLIIRVYGETVNPFIKLKDKNTGEILQSVKFNNLTVANGTYLEINSMPESAYIEVVNIESGERIDVENYADEETTIFMTIPVGSYVIEATDDVPTNIVQTRVYFTNQYKGA